MRTKLNTLEGNNYIILYPALIGGEYLAHSLSLAVPGYNANPMVWAGQHATIQCYTNFTQTDPFVNPAYEYDSSKSIIVRDHINPELDKYKDMPGLTPILLYSVNIDMWWHKRWRTLYKYVDKSVVTLEWLQEHVSTECDEAFLDTILIIAPDQFTIPDIILYWETGDDGFGRSHEHRKRDNIRHIREHMLEYENYKRLFNTPYKVNMDYVYQNWYRFEHAIKSIFEDIDVIKFKELWSAWLERNS